MDVVRPRCAGIDISKRDAKVCVRIQGLGKRRTASTVTTWGAMTEVVRAIGMIKALPLDAAQLVIKFCRVTDANRRDSVHDGLRVAPARPSARRSRRGHVR